MKSFIAAIVGMVLNAFPCQAIEFKGDAEQAQYLTLERLQWRKELREADKTNMVNGLKSANEAIAGRALTVAVVHGQKDALLAVRTIGPEGDVRVVADRVMEYWRKGDDPLRGLRKLIGECQKPVALKGPGGRTVPAAVARLIADVARHVVVVDQVRKLRSGRLTEPEVGGIVLTSAEENLLKYGRLPFEKAVPQVLAELAGVAVIGSKGYGLIGVLSAYDGQCIDAVIARLKTGADVSGQEAVALLTYLWRESWLLNEAEKRALYDSVEPLKMPGRRARTLQDAFLGKLAGWES